MSYINNTNEFFIHRLYDRIIELKSILRTFNAGHTY